MTSLIRVTRLPLARCVLTCCVVAVLGVCATAVLGQDVPTPAPLAAPNATSGPAGGGIDMESGLLPSFMDLFEYSPYINGIILGLSVVSVLLFLFLLITVNSRAMVPADLVEELTKLVMRGKYEAVADLCRAHRRVFIATIVQRCAENAGKTHAVLMEIVDSEGRRRAEIIWNRVSYLADIANVAPMLGLLGTVIGMIKAFFTLDTEAGGAASRLLASGIGQAMSTTMFGLAVAIGTLMLYSIIKSRATQSLAQAEQAVHAIADHMKRTPTAGGVDAPSTTGGFATPSLRSRPRPGAIAGDEA